MKVPLLDLKAQYQTIKEEVNEAIQECINAQMFILGETVKRFEHEVSSFLNCQHAIGVSSGTDALLIALMALNLQEGDEVIVPDYSFFSTAGTVSRLGATPIFVDIDPISYNINPTLIEQSITPKTKGIIPVHLYGQAAEMDAIMQIAKKHKLWVVEDAAQAMSTQYKDGRFAGTIGDIGCFSFFPSKNLGAFGDAGMVVTNNDELAEKLSILRVHGAKPKYHHQVIGGNFRLDAIQAAVLSVKLKYLDQWSEKRRRNADLYRKLFLESGLATDDNRGKVILPTESYQHFNVKNHHIYNQFVIRVEQRDALKIHLKEKGIGTEVYYPVPFHAQECFSDLNPPACSSLESTLAAEQTLALPIYPELTEKMMEYVIEKIADFYR